MALAWPSQRAGVVPLERVDYRSPSLQLLVDRLEAPGRNEILDLGPATGTNVEFFTGVPCRLHIQDIGRSLIPGLGSTPADEAPADTRARIDRMLAKVLTYDGDARFDIILGWDLFNYMSPDAIRVLMTRIGAQCRDGALLFLMVSTLEEMPSSPARVTMSSDRRIIYEPRVGSIVDCPRYTPLALERMMPRFRLFHSFLLGDGMQDYLFCYQ